MIEASPIAQVGRVNKLWSSLWHVPCSSYAVSFRCNHRVTRIAELRNYLCSTIRIESLGCRPIEALIVQQASAKKNRPIAAEFI